MRRDSFLQWPTPERDFHEDDRWTEKEREIKNAIFAAALQHHVKMEKNAALLESGGKHQQFWQDIPEQIMMVYGVDAHCPEVSVAEYNC